MADGNTGHGCARLQASLNDLGLEQFGIRASFAHGNPGDKGERVRLNTRTPSPLKLEFGKLVRRTLTNFLNSQYFVTRHGSQRVVCLHRVALARYVSLFPIAV